MKHFRDFINESKKNMIHKNTGKIAKLTIEKKYKTKDNNLKKKLEEFTKKFKKTHKIKESLFEASNEWNKNKDQIMNNIKDDLFSEISYFMQNNLDDWKTCWDSSEDMDRDLDTAEDWFWNEIDDYIDPIIDSVVDFDIDEMEIENSDIWDYAVEHWKSEINELISGLCDETRDYARDKYFDDEEEYYDNEEE